MNMLMGNMDGCKRGSRWPNERSFGAPEIGYGGKRKCSGNRICLYLASGRKRLREGRSGSGKISRKYNFSRLTLKLYADL